jgi:hypothetical protein
VTRVREMIRQEQACCAFMTFEMHEHPDEVVLTIRAPEDARPAAVALFEQFIAAARGTEAHGCMA